MSRLPISGSDNGTWGNVLNDYLSQSLNSDGTLKPSAVSASGAATDSTVVHNTGPETIAGTKTFQASPVLPTPTLGSHATTKTYVDSTVSAGAPDATTTTKGLVQLTGDLAGTATAPTVPGLATKEPTITTGTTGQYYRGDKTFQTLDKTAVGLANVDNTSDANKPVSTATTTALNLKIDKSTATTKGDILAATAASTITRVGVGTDGQILTADAASAPGVKWASAPTAPVTSVVGQTGIITGAQIAADSALTSTYGRKLGVYVDNFAGADPTGATDSTTAFVLALAALPTVTVHGTVTTPGKPGSAGSGTSATYPIGTIILGSGTYRIGTTSDIGNLGPFVSLIGPGHNACVLDYRGTGDALRAFNAVRPAGDTFFNLNGMSGRFDGLTIAGENAGAGAGGLHIGDGEGWILGADLDIRNFSGAESRGLWLDNNYSWTENITGSAAISNCTTLVEVSGGHGSTVQNGFTGGDNSFMYNKLSFKLYAFEQQNGIVFSNGAYFANGMLTIRANMKKNAATQTNALITLTGVCPAGHLGAGTYSQINTSHIDLTAEVNGSGVSSPMTVQYGDVVHNGIFGSYGLMAFSGGNAWTVSNWTLAGSFAVNNFNFQGIVYGDFNLKPGQGPGFTGAVYYGATTLFPDGGLAMDTGDYAAPCTLTSNLTVNMQNNRNGPQHKVITVKQAASGGPYTVTWPHAASPTYAAPTVLWAGGTAPTMTVAANAVDVYDLVTADGATWYGRATQNVS